VEDGGRAEAQVIGTLADAGEAELLVSEPARAD